MVLYKKEFCPSVVLALICLNDFLCPTLHFFMGRSECKNKFHGYKDENPSKCFFFHDLGLAQISDCYVVGLYLLCHSRPITGTHWVP